jgi:malate synthase
MELHHFYLPKLEHYLEARWWNKVFNLRKNIEVQMELLKQAVLVKLLQFSIRRNNFRT